MAARPLLIYDDACPLCQAYTAGFKRLGWVDRTGFSQTDGQLRQVLNLDRARHEIPLYDPETTSVRYGLDALFTLIGSEVPLLRPILQWRVTRYFFYPFYQLITYNRRVIAGTPPPPDGFDCAPDYHRGWRWVYVLLAVVVSLLAVPDLQSTLPAAKMGYYGTVFGLFLLLLLGFRRQLDRLDYLGHWVSLTLLATLLMAVLPAAGASGWLVLGLTGWAAYRRRWVIRTETVQRSVPADR